MTKQCENILLYIDNELRDPERNVFIDHLKNCEDCRIALTAYEENYQALSEPCEVLSKKEKNSLWNDINSSVSNSQNSGWQVSKRWLVAAAVVLFALNTFSIFTAFQNNSSYSGQTKVAYENTSEEWFGYSAVDNMIYELADNGGDDNE